MQPEVIPGLRPPRTTRMDSMAAVADAGRAIPTPALSADPAVTVYVSATRRYRVEVAAPTQAVDPVTGRKLTTRKRITAEFEEGVYRNKHRDPTIRAIIDAELQANPYFGPFGSTAHFWLASEQQAKAEQKRVDSALATLKSLPREQVEQYIAALKQGEAADHALASAPAPVRPIPA